MIQALFDRLRRNPHAFAARAPSPGGTSSLSLAGLVSIPDEASSPFLTPPSLLDLQFIKCKVLALTPCPGLSKLPALTFTCEG